MMKKENIKLTRSRESRLLDIFVVLICLGGAFFGIYMFWRDLNKTLAKLSETSVGTISYKYNGVQRRFSDRLMWSQLQTESPVYAGDIIRTAGLSDATITFHDKNSIELAENCLIQIFYGTEGVRVELSGGTFTANAQTDGLVIVSGGNELTLNAGAAVTTASTGNNLDIQVVSGTIALNTEGVTQTIEAGTAVTVAADGRIETPPRVVVLLPLPDARILGAENERQQIPFTWKKSNFSANESVRLEIATDRHFTQLTESLDAAEDGTVVSLPPGIWWWRAYPLSQSAESKEEAAVGKLTVTTQELSIAAALPAVVQETPKAPAPVSPAPVPITLLAAPGNMSPASGFTLGVAEVRRSRAITFSWNAVAGANAYDFSLYRDSVNGTPVLNIRVTETGYTISDIGSLDNGNFIWYVEALNLSEPPRRGQIAESRFTINIPLPAKPTLGVSGEIYDD